MTNKQCIDWNIQLAISLFVSPNRTSHLLRAYAHSAAQRFRFVFDAFGIWCSDSVKIMRTQFIRPPFLSLHVVVVVFFLLQKVPIKKADYQSLAVRSNGCSVWSVLTASRFPLNWFFFFCPLFVSVCLHLFVISCCIENCNQTELVYTSVIAKTYKSNIE